MNDLIKRFASFKKEPAVWISVIYVVALTGYKVLGPDKMSISDVFTQDYIDYVGALVAGVFTRLSVFSPDTVKQLTGSK